MNYNTKNYKKSQIETASPGQILILLYEGALLNIRKAIQAIEKNQPAEKGKWIGKTHDIINELSVSLNHTVGGDITRELERLYQFMIEQLLKANIENNQEPLKIVQKNLEILLEGWRGAVAQFQKETR